MRQLLQPLRPAEHPAATDTATDTITEAPPVDRRSLTGVLLTGLASFVSIAWFTPTSPHPERAITLLGLAVETLFWGCAFFGAYALVQRRAALGFSLVAGAAGVLLFDVIACPVSGHHSFGAWWAIQLATTTAFVAVSSVAAAASRRAAR